MAGDVYPQKLLSFSISLHAIFIFTYSLFTQIFHENYDFLKISFFSKMLPGKSVSNNYCYKNKIIQYFNSVVCCKANLT